MLRVELLAKSGSYWIHAEAVGEAWLRIEQHFKKGGEGQHVVRRLVDVYTLAKNSPLVPLDYRRSLERLSQLKDFADQLYVYFTDEIRRDPLWAIIAGSHLSNERNFKDMVASLRHIRLFLAGREEEFSRFSVRWAFLVRSRLPAHNVLCSAPP